MGQGTKNFEQCQTLDEFVRLLTEQFSHNSMCRTVQVDMLLLKQGTMPIMEFYLPKHNLWECYHHNKKEIEETYFEIIQPFKQQYETIVANLSNHRANLLLCTVYEGDLVDSDEFSDVINSSKTMVSIFNDIVYRTANKFNVDVLELRNIFTSPQDYANPIEPSHIGGEKLAQEIIHWTNATK